MTESYSLVLGCHHAVLIPDDVDAVNTRLPSRRGRVLWLVPWLSTTELCTKALGITLLPFDLTSGAVYAHLARILLDVLDYTWSYRASLLLLPNPVYNHSRRPISISRTACVLMHATCDRRQRF